MRTPSMNLEARGLVPAGETDTSVSPFDAKEDDSAVKALKKGKKGRFGGLSFRKPSSKTREEVSFERMSWSTAGAILLYNSVLD